MKKILLHIVRSCKLAVAFGFTWVFLSGLSSGQKFSVNDNYKAIFGNKYNEAFAYFFSNSWIADTIKSYNIDPAFAKAIVFPELIRYSVLRDKIEVGGLLSLYVQYGQKYADFSVGRFQMKPTFAMQLEMDIQKFGLSKTFLNINIDLSETFQTRLDRVKRLDSPIWQVRYLVYFIKVMDAKYQSKVWTTIAEKLRFYATAYNSGYTLAEGKINERIGFKMFHTGIIKSDTLFCYAEIAEDYYKKCSNCLQ